MRWAAQEEFLRKMAEATGSTPQALANKPVLQADGRGVLRAYDLIDQARQYDQAGPQAIAISEILAYLEIARIEEVEDRLLFLSTIKQLDVIFLNHFAEQRRP